MVLKRRSAFTVIEIIIDIGVISLVATAILSLMIMNFKSASYAQLKVVATNLANDRMEMIRSLPYDDVATEHGPILPQKSLKDSELINYAGYQLTIAIDARYYDDPYDHLATDASPNTDTSPIDYKKVKVSVMASGHPNAVAELSTNIASEAAETSSNTGILLVKVVDNPEKGDQPIEQASVHIVNTSVSPSVDITAETDALGYLMVPQLPPASNNSYQVTITKNGYSTDTTLPLGTCSNSVSASPSANLNPNIIVQRVTSITMQIRCLTDLNISVKDKNGAPLAGSSVRVQSSRLLCTDPKSKYDQWKTTDASGVINVNQIEHDTYFYTTASGSSCPASCPVSIVSYGDDYNPALCQTIHAIVNTGDTLNFITISDVSPRHPDPAYNGEFTFVGTNLNSLASAKFVRSGQPDIVGQIVSKDVDNAVVTFNMNGAANGSWDLSVTNSSAETSLKNNAIEVSGN